MKEKVTKQKLKDQREKKMSKVDTLKHAVDYIQNLHHIYLIIFGFYSVDRL